MRVVDFNYTVTLYLNLKYTYFWMHICFDPL